jgi:CheY-like chemotaxis protein
MAVHLPTLAVGLSFGGLVPLVGAYGPYLAQAVDSVSSAVPAGSSSVYFGLGVLVTAVGTAIIQPYLKERGTAEKLTIAMRQIDENTRQIEAMKALVNAKDDTIRAKEARVDELVKQLALATESNSRLADRLFRTSGKLLEVVGKIRPLTEALRPIPADYAGPRHTVLLLEDDDDARVAMAGALELLGLDVTAVETVTDARDAINRTAFDALIADLMLPDGDGADIIRVVRQRALPTRVIVTTGRSDDALAPVYALKPDRLFHKPVEMAELVAAVRGIPGEEHPIDAPRLAILPVAADAVVSPANKI